MKRDLARVFVTTPDDDSDHLAGFFTLSAGSVNCSDSPSLGRVGFSVFGDETFGANVGGFFFCTKTLADALTAGSTLVVCTLFRAGVSVTTVLLGNTLGLLSSDFTPTVIGLLSK